MNEVVIDNQIIIENLIYEIRGKQVMLDSDLARLYSVRQKELMKLLKIIHKNFQKDLVLN